MDRDHGQQDADPACRIVEILPALDKALRCLWIRYRGRSESWRQLEDHLQNLVLLLIEDDYRRLRSHDPSRSLDAWLYSVVRHYLADCLSGRIPTGDWSEDLPGALRIEAGQEDELIDRERLRRLQEVFGRLSDRERLLGESLLSGLETGEIALLLKIEPRRVRKRRHELIKKIRKRLAEWGTGAEKT
jgi:RNA polymerase sigma factor (sigma-70 family)